MSCTKVLTRESERERRRRRRRREWFIPALISHAASDVFDVHRGMQGREGAIKGAAWRTVIILGDVSSERPLRVRLRLSPWYR